MFSVKGESGSFLRRTGVTWEFRDVVRFQGKQICDCSRPAYVINLVKRNKFQPGTRERLRAFLNLFIYFFFFENESCCTTRQTKSKTTISCIAHADCVEIQSLDDMQDLVTLLKSTYRINTFWFVVFMNSFHRVGKVTKVLWWVRHDRL